MPGNTFGNLFRLTTFGESHGSAIGAVIDGCPAGLMLSAQDIQTELDRRRPGQSQYTAQRHEHDAVEILSGVFEGLTTGTPIALLIKNNDARSKNYDHIKNEFRPGHADYTYHHKYGVRDYRGGGRASARETAMRVAAGAIAKKFLSQQGIKIQGYLAAMGNIHADPIDLSIVNDNAFFCADLGKVSEMETLITQLRRDGDSIGARVNVIATGVPVGLGEPIYDKISANIASAMMGINAAKGVEIGAGFQAVQQKGSEHRDEITPSGFTKNDAGGVLGGISSGQDIVASVAFKPTSSIRIPAKTIDVEGNACEISTTGRHDPCVGIRAVPVVEAMLALVIMDHWLCYQAYQQANAVSADSTKYTVKTTVSSE